MGGYWEEVGRTATNRRNAMRRAEANAKWGALDFEQELCSIRMHMYIYLCPDNKLAAGFWDGWGVRLRLRAEKPIKTEGFCKMTPIYHDNVDQF